MRAIIDLNGQRFGRLVVLGRAEHKSGKIAWKCQCDCGKIKIVLSGDLRSGQTKSCGCLRDEKMAKSFTTHGLSKTRLNKTYRGMKQRCYNPNNHKYPYYGGRGITICEKWLNDFRAFYDWAMSHGYADDLTIDRMDNDGNYCPENCRWETAKVQANNKRDYPTTQYVTANGITKSLSEWVKETGLNKNTIRGRIRNGWSPERAVGMPPDTDHTKSRRH